MRLQVLLARAGVASRRECASIISAGRVSVDGVVITVPGFRVACGVRVQLDGKPIITDPERIRTILLNKPRGYICSRKRQSKSDRLVYDLIPEIGERLTTVGRLDKDSEGLILLCNDGTLTHQLTHPRYGHRKIYEVQTVASVSPEQLQTLRDCRSISGEAIQPVRIEFGPGSDQRKVLIFELTEGRNRQIRRMCEQAEIEIDRLVRLQMGCLTLGELAPGQWRDLAKEEIGLLLPSRDVLLP